MMVDSLMVNWYNGQLVQWSIGRIGRYQITDAVKSAILISYRQMDRQTFAIL